MPLHGDSSPSLDTSVTFNTGISSGETYVFAVYGRNAHGDGPQSATVSILAATVPSPMNAPTISAISTHTALQYRVSVVAPHTGGDNVLITSFEVVFKHRNSATYESIADCDGSAASFMTNSYCDVDLTTLTGAPLNLVLGDPIVAKVRAKNVLGDGDYSSDSDGAALVVSIPSTPTQAPYRQESSSSTTSMTLNMPLISAGADSGGMTILSYKLEWDQGGSTWTPLVGASSESLATSFTVSGLTVGQAYSFRYIVSNEVGWSAAYSPVLSTYSATVPG